MEVQYKQLALWQVGEFLMAAGMKIPKRLSVQGKRDAMNADETCTVKFTSKNEGTERPPSLSTHGVGFWQRFVIF